MPATLFYYLDDFSDEVVPCEPTLAGWAAWLARPDEMFGRDTPVDDGSTFSASVLSLGPDLIATRIDGVLELDRDPAPFDFFAIRFDAGLGWSADDIADDPDVLRDLLVEHALCGTDGDTVYIAAGNWLPDVKITFSASACIVSDKEPARVG